MDILSTGIWQDIFGVSNETAFIALTPLLIFVLGLLLRWISNKTKLHKENKQKREFLFSQVEVLINAIEKQRESCSNYIKLLQDESNINRLFVFIVAFNSKHIYQIGSNELFKLLVLNYFTDKQKRLNHFNDLIRQLDLIDAMRKEIELSFESSNKLLSQYEEEWNINLEFIRRMSDNWDSSLLAQGINPKDDSFIYNFKNVRTQWQLNPNRTKMYVADSIFIEQLLKETRIHSTNVFAVQMLSPILKCKEAINNHRNTRTIKISDFEHYVSQLDSMKATLTGFLSFNNYSLRLNQKIEDKSQ